MSLQVELGDRKLTGTSSLEDAKAMIKDRPVLMLLQNLSLPAIWPLVTEGLTPVTEMKDEAVLLKVDKNILGNNAFNNLLTERKKAELEHFNKHGLEIQEDQLVIIVNETPDMFPLLKQLIATRASDPLTHLIMTMRLIDKYQAYQAFKKDIKKVVALWTLDLAEENQEFWSNLRDNFNPMFQKRRFRLELPKNQTDDAKKLILEAENTQLLLDKADDEDLGEKKKYQLTRDEYQKVAEEDKKYADLCDEQFKNSKQTAEIDNEIVEIMRKLVEHGEWSVLIHLWSVLAASQKYYHLALTTDALKAIRQHDVNKITDQMYVYLIYLMYREECCVKRGVTPGHRFVTTLRQLDEMNLRTLGWNYVSPLPYNHEPVSSNYSSGAKFRKFAQFKEFFSKVSMGVFDAFKREDFIITGGILSLCAIRTEKENTFDSPGITGLGEPGPKTKFQNILNKAYRGADLDIAVFANDEKDFLDKIGILEAQVNKVLGNQADSKADTKACLTESGILSTTSSVVYKFVPKENAEGRYRLTLPNLLVLEVFQIKQGRNGASLVYNFHVPCVRMFYDLKKDDVFILPSALHAGMTGVCLDVKYFGTSTTPMQIVGKYMNRGFSFILNEIEERMMRKEFHLHHDGMYSGRRSTKKIFTCLIGNFWVCKLEFPKTGQGRVNKISWHATPPFVVPIDLPAFKLDLAKPAEDKCFNCEGKQKQHGLCQGCIDDAVTKGSDFSMVKQRFEMRKKLADPDVKYFTMPDPNKVEKEGKCSYVYKAGTNRARTCGKKTEAGEMLCRIHKKQVTRIPPLPLAPAGIPIAPVTMAVPFTLPAPAKQG